MAFNLSTFIDIFCHLPFLKLYTPTPVHMRERKEGEKARIQVEGRGRCFSGRDWLLARNGGVYGCTLFAILTTVHHPDSETVRNRKRPGKKSTNAKKAREAFGDDQEKEERGEGAGRERQVASTTVREEDGWRILSSSGPS